jgi:RNA polymerase sigma factor (sigma-70 family)
MKIRSYTDEEVFSGIHRQDDKVLLFIYRKDFESVKHFIEMNSGTGQDAQDIFQDAMILVYSKVKSGELVLQCSFSTYLFSVVKILWLKQLEKAKRKNTFTEECDDFADHHEGILEEIHQAERKSLIVRYFNELSDDCKRIIRLFMKELSISEITKVMGYSSEQHTKNRRFRCKKSLYERIIQNPHYKEFTNGRVGNDNEIPRW